MLTAEEDEGLDGEIDWSRVFTRDAEGRLIVQDEYYPVPRDYDYDGVPDGPSRVQGRYTYDEQGCLILSETDDEADGTVESYVTYECDENGNHVLQESYGAPGQMTGRKKWTYDEDGNMLTEQVERGDGSLRRTTVYTYDAEGNLSTEEEISPDGVTDHRIEYSYDEFGNILAEKTYAGADGVLVYAQSYGYECWE
jgi:hypothetical protein